jgi:hypothetical protein
MARSSVPIFFFSFIGSPPFICSPGERLNEQGQRRHHANTDQADQNQFDQFTFRVVPPRPVRKKICLALDYCNESLMIA